MPKKPAARSKTPRSTSAKDSSLEPFRDRHEGTTLTSDQGVRIANTDDSLKAGPRGPTLLEDFHLREKIMRFDHERIPERVVHARGAAAHGFFQVYESLSEYTSAHFLNDPALRTPVFVRFSTVGGSRGSADTPRDVRGFATKFYTEEGNFDLVGNNMPVFFIQDGIKFPDFVHAVKPEPKDEIPQASSAHDSFWDFVSLQTESTHMVLWLMSDRALPRSYSMMEGFGVHTFRLVNAEGKAHLVKFHWKPVLGAHSLVWDEAQKLMGKDPDFNRRDLGDSIRAGDFPEFELGLQIIPEADVLKYGFDLLDSTKLLPEELVPVQRVGKLVLNRNPDNFFAETEQVAFCVGNVVPGIDFTNDPLLQARLFSYLDTQLTRLGGPNFAEIPINRPVCPVHNHQQDGFSRHTIPTNVANYHPNTTGGGCPMLAGEDSGAFQHYEERVESRVIRARSDSFSDHFSQAKLFFDSLSKPEQEHLVQALEFELAKVERMEIRQRVIDAMLVNVNPQVAARVARAVGAHAPKGAAKTPASKKGAKSATKLDVSPALSLMSTPHTSIKTRKIAVLLAEGFSSKELTQAQATLEALGAKLEIIAPTLGETESEDGVVVIPAKTFLTAASVFYDAVFVPGGKASIQALRNLPKAKEFLREADEHCKAIAAVGEGAELLRSAGLNIPDGKKGVAERFGILVAAGGDTKAFAKQFAAAIAKHRHFEREAPPPA